MKLTKTFLKIAAPVIALLGLTVGASAQNVTYTANNSATATANANGTSVTDISNNGATITRLNQDLTPINFPMIGVSKTASVSSIKTNGTYDVTYTIKVQNYGAIDLKSVTLTDDLTTAFPSPVTFTKVSLTASNVTSGSSLSVAFFYNGSTNKTLNGSVSTFLKAGGSGTLTLVINVDPHGNFSTFNNTVNASAVTNDASAVTVTDNSTNNASPNHSDGTKTPLDFDDPTPVTLLPPDIKITKTVDKLTPKVGENVTFTVKAENIGTGGAAPVSVTDLLPAGFTFVSATASAGTYDSATGLWSGIGILAPAAQQTLTIVATVLPNKTVAEYTNTASNTQPGDSDPTNNSSSAVVTPVPVADLAVVNTDGKSSYVPGKINTYTVTVNNNGPSDVTGATVTFPLPTGVTGTWAAVYTGGATGAASGTGAINEAVNMPAGSKIVYTFIANVASNVTADPLTTTATVTPPSGTVDTDLTNNTSSDSDTFSPVTDLKVVKTVDNATPTVGNNVVFTITASNNGPSDATGAKVTDVLKTGYTYVSSTTPTAGTFDNTTGVWTIGSFVNGATATLTVTAKVNADVVASEYGNTAAITGNESDPDLSNNTSTVTPVPVPLTDLVVTKIVDTNTPNVTDNVTFTITVGNNGPSKATGVKMTDVLKAGYTFVSATPSAGTFDSATGVWTIGTVNNGANATIAIVAKVNANQTGNYDNTATVTGNEQEVTLTNNTSTVNTIVPVPVADLAVTNNDGKATYIPGNPNIYTVEVTNNGPSDVTGATVTYPFPTGVTGTWTATYSGGATGAASGTGAINASVNMPAGSKITYTVMANVASNVATNPLTTTATVTAPLGTTDSNLSNNIASDADTYAPQVDLAITNDDHQPNYTPGTANTYKVVVSNSGPSDANNATVTYPFPTGVTGTWTATYSGGATGAASGTGAINESVNVPSGGSITYTITANVASNVTANPLTTTATVTAAAGTTDSNLSNNIASDADTYAPQVDLAITNDDHQLNYTPGTTNTYKVVVNNSGPSDANNATVTYPFPTGVTGTWTATYSGGATGVASGTGAINESVNVPSGGSITYTITANVASNVTANPLTTTATVTAAAGTTDSDLSNNTASDADALNPEVDLKITNDDHQLNYTPGTINTYKVVVNNSGPSDANNATVTYPFPTGVTGTWTATYSGGATGVASGTGAINESVNVPSGGSITYTVTANVASNVTANPLTTTATVTAAAGTTDSDLSNNTAPDADVYAPLVDLAITNTDGKTNYTPGTTNTYTVVVSNSGPSDATGATVTYPFPAGVTGTWTATYLGGATGTASGAGAINQSVNVPSGGSITYTIIASVASNVTVNPLTTTATVAAPAGYTDATPGNNSASDADTFNPSADLKVVKVVDNLAPNAGSNVTFTITATNNGPSDATGVKVTDVLKTGYTFVSGTASAGTYNNTTGIWTIGNVVKGATANLTVTAKVNADVVATEYANTAAITGNETDPDVTNNTSTVTPVPVPLMDLAISQTVSNSTPDAGSNVTFTITVNNNGPSKATGVNVNDLLKAGYTFVSANPAVGTYNSTTGLWNIGTLNSGGTTTLTIVAKVNPDNTTANYVNNAVVAGTEQEVTLVNNTSVQNVTPVAVTDLKVVKTVSKAAPSINTQVTFTVAASNNGPSTATNVKVTDILPSGFTYVSSSPSTGTYNTSTGVWTIGSLANNGNATITMVARVNATGNYTNIATITGTEKDNDPTNNTSQVTITAKQLPVANDNTAKTNPNTPVDIDILGNDVKAEADLVPGTVTVISPVQHGTVIFDPATGKATYTPNPGYYGTDVFTYTVADANGGTSNVATVTITINKPPVATDDNAVTLMNTPVNINIPANDVKGDANLVPSTIVVTQQPQHGTVSIDPATGIANYTPNNGYYGPDNFKYTIKDQNGAISNIANVNITVPKPPVANNDNATTNPNTPVTIDIPANDVKGDADLNPATITIIQQPQHGTLTIDPVTGKVVYTPATNFSGDDVFTYTIKDKNGSVSNVATVNIKINDKPVIGIAKSIVSAVKTVNGSYDITYQFTVGNYGITAINNVSIKDDLTPVFGVERFTVKSVKSLGKLTVNTGYDGRNNTELLQPGNTLAVGQVEQMQMVVNLALVSNGSTYLNSATAAGTSITGISTTDQSTDGNKPDPNTAGDVSLSKPTPLVLEKPKEFIPGGFSPNNDGVNDKFVIENAGSRRIDIEIYNRWGNLVYRNNNYQNDWDGKCNQGIHIGEELPVGTYFYIVKFDDKDRYVGYITLNR